LGQEFLHQRTHADRVQFSLSRDAFRDIGPLLDAALGSILDTPLGHLLGDYMLALDQGLAAVTQAICRAGQVGALADAEKPVAVGSGGFRRAPTRILAAHRGPDVTSCVPRGLPSRVYAQMMKR
jgi:hypothetical protein